jgi:hypothetical protein
MSQGVVVDDLNLDLVRFRRADVLPRVDGTDVELVDEPAGDLKIAYMKNEGTAGN